MTDLVDMGAAVAPEYAGILTPRSDLRADKVGVTEQFLEGAETFHSKYTQLDYYRHLLRGAAGQIGSVPEGAVVFDIGSGSGNSVIPVLEIFPSSKVVATDISQNLLRILRDYARQSELYPDRLSLVCMDASRPYLKAGSVDLAIGAAILHHLIDPFAAIESACRALKPGGHAIFFEPFENGNAILRLAYTEILERANASGNSPERGRGGRADVGDLPEDVAGFLRRMVHDYVVRSGSDKSADIYRRIDDKWLFTRSYFEDAAAKLNVSGLTIYPLHDTVAPFANQTAVNLRLALGAAKERLPAWAWDVIAKYEGSFSPELKRDLLIEGCVIFTV